MTEDTRFGGLRIALVVAGVVCLLAASPCILLGTLGLAGVVADVGPDENRDIGRGFLLWSLVPGGLGALLLALAWVLRPRRSADAIDQSPDSR